MKRLLHHARRVFGGITVLALVGKPGTGKSFRARLVAERFGVDLVVDDGLLMKGDRILAGQSAKKEKHYVAAIKVAVFTDSQRAKELQKALAAERVSKVLILGTSDRMVHRIAERLNLPAPSRIIRIDDVATPEEIAEARRSRLEEGKHIIPLPALEVKRDHGHIFQDSIRILLRRWPWTSRGRRHEVEKSIVRPLYTQRGRVTVSEEALTQMVVHCVRDYQDSLRTRKVVIDPVDGEYVLEVVVSPPLGMAVSPDLFTLQQSILRHIETFAGISLREVHLTVGRFYKPDDT